MIASSAAGWMVRTRMLTLQSDSVLDALPGVPFAIVLDLASGFWWVDTSVLIGQKER
jgi:hypothetical protein